MARCLRCRAGNEWIEGNVKDIDVDSLQKELDEALTAMEFYADKKNHRPRVDGITEIVIEISACHKDFGKKARKVLGRLG